MPRPKSIRRPGGQPGNLNRLKHGLYRHKPAPGQRKRGGQPGNLNHLVHGRNSSILMPAPSASSPLARRTAPSALQASLATIISLLELQLLDLLNDPRYSPAELSLCLHELNAQLGQMLHNLPKTPPSETHHPERNLQ
jgi:hypothetical protein